MTNRDTVCLIFGTFNPTTNAHINMAKVIHEKVPAADIIYVPAKKRFLESWKGLGTEHILQDKDRCSLLKEALEELTYAAVSTVEIDGLTDGKTYNTLRYFRETCGYSKLFLCFGTDKVAELERWYMGREMIAENSFLILTRDEALEAVMTDYTRQYAEHFAEVKSDMPGVSATQVREACESGDWELVKELVPANVYEYMKNKK